MSNKMDRVENVAEKRIKNVKIKWIKERKDDLPSAMGMIAHLAK